MKKIINIYTNYQEIINYLIFGVLTTIISLLTYYILTLTIITPTNPYLLQLANIISWIASVTFAYITNRKYVFKSKNNNKIKEISKFTISRIATLIMDMLTMFIGVTLLKKDDRIIKILSQIIVVISNYILSKILVFKKEK